MAMPPSQSGRAPILECVRAGFAFLARDWRAIAPVAAVGAALLTPAEVWADVAMARSDLGGGVLASIVALAAQAPTLAAYYRRALSQGAAPLALRFGADERNVAGVSLSLGFFFLIVFLVLLFIVMLLLAGLLAGADVTAESLQGLAPEEAARQFIAALGAEGRAIFFLLLLAGACLMIFLSARLALAWPATVAEGRMQVFSAWSWTKGNAAPVAACLVLLGLGALAFSIVAALVPSVLVGAAFGEAAMRAPGTPAHWIMSYVSALIGLMFVYAPYAGMTAYLYRGLRPPE